MIHASARIEENKTSVGGWGLRFIPFHELHEGFFVAPDTKTELYYSHMIIIGSSL